MNDRKLGWFILIVAVAGALTLGLSILIVTRISLDNERRSCAVLMADIRVYEETPPSTDTGRNLEVAKRNLYRDLGCVPEMTEKVTQ